MSEVPTRLQAVGCRRVLFVTHVGDPGGAELKMLDLARSVRDSCEVLLFQHGSLEAMLHEQQIKASVCPMPPGMRKVRREGGVRSIVRAVPGVFSMLRGVAGKARQFDVIVCFSQKSFVLVALAKPFMRGRVLWFMNDIVSASHFSRPLMRLLTALSRIGADHVVVNSQASLDAWIDAGGRRRGVSVIYPGIQDQQIDSQLRDPRRSAAYRQQYSPQGRPLVGMFGRIGRWKGQDVFLRAIAELPEVRAVVVGGALFGEEEYDREIRALARDLGIESRVSFVGHVNDVMTVMAACDVIAHCSTAPEPFGLVIAEAMLVGVPVIASDAGGAREIVLPGDTGQLTPMRDHAALAAAINRYLADPAWARSIAQRATTRAREKFSGTAMEAGFFATLATL